MELIFTHTVVQHEPHQSQLVMQFMQTTNLYRLGCQQPHSHNSLRPLWTKEPSDLATKSMIDDLWATILVATRFLSAVAVTVTSLRRRWLQGLRRVQTHTHTHTYIHRPTRAHSCTCTCVHNSSLRYNYMCSLNRLQDYSLFTRLPKQAAYRDTHIKNYKTYFLGIFEMN